MANRSGNSGNSERLYILGSKITADGDCNHEIKKTLAPCKKIRDTKGTFHAKMGSMKDRNDMDLTEAEDIKRDGKNTQKNCTKRASQPR